MCVRLPNLIKSCIPMNQWMNSHSLVCLFTYMLTSQQLATFMSMAYILAVNPRILADSGGPCPTEILGTDEGFVCLEAVKREYITSTAIASMIGCFFMGKWVESSSKISQSVWCVVCDAADSLAACVMALVETLNQVAAKANPLNWSLFIDRPTDWSTCCCCCGGSFFAWVNQCKWHAWIHPCGPHHISHLCLLLRHVYDDGVFLSWSFSVVLFLTQISIYSLLYLPSSGMGANLPIALAPGMGMNAVSAWEKKLTNAQEPNEWFQRFH